MKRINRLFGGFSTEPVFVEKKAFSHDLWFERLFPRPDAEFDDIASAKNAEGDFLFWWVKGGEQILKIALRDLSEGFWVYWRHLRRPWEC